MVGPVGANRSDALAVFISSDGQRIDWSSPCGPERITTMSEKTSVMPATTNGSKEAKARRWEPIDLLTQMQNEFDRFWDERWPAWRSMRRLPGMTSTWSPRADVFEKDGKIVVKAELPGVKKEDVDVSIENGDLIIHGERHAEEKVEEKDYYRMERSSGSFYRRLPLPEGVTSEQITATYKDGVLEVTAPAASAQKAEAKKISIN